MIPFKIACDTCGVSMSFDIVSQKFECDYCGNSKFLSVQNDVVQNWANSIKDDFDRDKDKIKKYECSSCSADINIISETEFLVCFNCGSSMVSVGFASSENFPVGVIPFKITMDEVIGILKNELNGSLKKLSKEKKQKIIKNIDSIIQVYLPFQFFSGRADVKVNRYGRYNSRKFNLKTFVNDKIIIACDNIDNDLIDCIEPYDLDELEKFEFIYITGCQAKTQDISYEKLKTKYEAELIEDARDSLCKKFGTSSLNISVYPEKDITMPVLLPVFSLNVDGINLSINGQTGKIAIKEDKKLSKSWMLKPFVFISLFCVFIYNLFADWILVASLGLGFAIFIFSVYANVNKSFFYNKFFVSKNHYKRKNYVLSKSKTKKSRVFQKPIFYENIDNKKRFVDIKFFPLRLRIFVFICMFFFSTMPIFIDVFSVEFGITKSKVFGSDFCAIWLGISLIYLLLYYFTYIKQSLYDRVYYRIYGTKGIYRYLKNSFSFFRFIKNSLGAFLHLTKWIFIIAVCTMLVIVRIFLYLYCINLFLGINLLPNV